ncbi:Protein CBG08227 [Caenorhabditis briggsae]|uniref:Metal transporter n=1 Tax=Caenorhabditis briggsae TaxID=6238 RepID=A8X636_CAEBR|nr:Protein CBG08227 [Caenorhabditis briggsae]CAP28097.2 Protein CBG08227 [Caenorhabditis briggsae]
MIALRIIFFVILIIIWKSYNALSTNPTIKLSGVQNSVQLRVKPDEEFKIRVLGKNLPGRGFFFTSATTCADAFIPNNEKISTIHAIVDETFCSSAILKFPQGLPFKVSKTYHLCHEKGNATSEHFLTIGAVDVLGQKYGMDVIILCCFCILMSAYAAGMTLGYMKFSIVELNTMINGGDAALAKRARRILNLRRRSNYLVTSFSLFSSIFTVLFTTNVEQMLKGAPNQSILNVAVPALISLVFAEMIPQAICNSKLGFNLASGLWFISYLIFIVTFPVAYPVSLVLGRFLKRDVREVLTEEEKNCMIQNMAKNANEKVKTILENATTFTNKKVGELMVPIEEVFMLSKSQKLNRSVIGYLILTILTLIEKGYTRVPVYHDKNRNTIVGLLNVKDLNLVTCQLSVEPMVKEVLDKLEKLKEAKKKVKFMAKYVNIDMNAQLLLNQMRTGDFHFACVVKYASYEYVLIFKRRFEILLLSSSKVIGIITIEDILEELFGKIDENNERKVRSSIDDRADNAVIGWCREAGTDSNYPLPFSQQLRILQYLLKECQVLKSLDIGILKAKQILMLNRIRTFHKGQELPLDDLFIVIWKGDVEVTNAEGETSYESISAPPLWLVSDNLIFIGIDLFSNSNEKEVEEKKPSVPVLIIGKKLLNKVMKSLGSPFLEPLKSSDNVKRVVVLRLEDLLNAINGCVQATKNENANAGDSLIQRLNSRQSTPVSTTPITRTPSKAAEPNPSEDVKPLLN